MLYKWTCYSASGDYRDITARQLGDLAASHTIQPTDRVVGMGVIIDGYKLKGLFLDATILEINWRGSGDDSNWPVTVSINNFVLGSGYFGPGFCFFAAIQPGRHVVEAKMSLYSPKYYNIDIPCAGVYCCDLLYSGGMWGNFQDLCNVYTQPATSSIEANTINYWEAERQAAQCPHCGTEWAVVHLGAEVIGREQQPRTITQREEQVMDNPNYTLYGDPLNNPRYLYGDAQRLIQVIAIVETIRDSFQCDICSNKWFKDRTHEYIP